MSTFASAIEQGTDAMTEHAEAMGLTKPALQQSAPGSRPYRLYTAAHVAFGAFPRYSEGGPALCAIGPIRTSLSSPTSMWGGEVADPRVTLYAYAPLHSDAPNHPLHGTKYATVDEATQVQFEAGFLAYMVYAPGSSFADREANDAIVAAERAEVTG